MPLFRRRETAFEDKVKALIEEAAGPGVEVVYDEQLDAFRHGSAITNLGNFRRNYDQIDKSDRDDWLRQHVLGMLQNALPEQLDDTSHLSVGVRSRTYLEAARLAAGLTGDGPPAAIPHRVIAGDLVAVILWDTPVSMVTLGDDQFSKWGRSFDELYPIALSNVAAMAVEGYAALDDRTFRFLGGDEYNSARFLVDEIMKQLPLTGNLVVCVPTRNTLIVTSADDAAGMKIAFDLAGNPAEEASVYFKPIVGRSPSWRLLELDDTHPAYAAWERLTRIEEADSAASVKDLLQQSVGEEVFVASISIFEEPQSGRLRTVCAWTEGVPTLLPRTDAVAFVRPIESGHDVREASWDWVTEHCSHLMEPTDHHPPRWLVEDFPPADLVDTLPPPTR